MAKVYAIQQVLVDIERSDYELLKDSDLDFCKAAGDFSMLISASLKAKGMKYIRTISKYPLVVEIQGWEIITP